MPFPNVSSVFRSRVVSGMLFLCLCMFGLGNRVWSGTSVIWLNIWYQRLVLISIVSLFQWENIKYLFFKRYSNAFKHRRSQVQCSDVKMSAFDPPKQQKVSFIRNLSSYSSTTFSLVLIVTICLITFSVLIVYPLLVLIQCSSWYVYVTGIQLWQISTKSATISVMIS